MAWTNVHRFTLRFLATLALVTTTYSAEARVPVEDTILFRSDASFGIGSYLQHVENSGGDSWETYAMALGPRLAVNLGYAPTRLVRLGLGASAAFALNAVEHQGIPNTELDGWMRWTVGPTVGFRFGPRVPLELEVGLAFSHSWIFGSQGFPADSDASLFDVGAKQFGTTSSALLFYRPGGPTSLFAVHAGLEGTWGLVQTHPSDGSTTTNTAFIHSLLLGLSLGL